MADKKTQVKSNVDKQYNKAQGLVKGAIILAIAGVACRLLGVVFRIPLSNIVGNYGIGLYQLVFPLYSLLLIISSAGVPVAISKMVARERDDTSKCKKILFNAVISLSLIGLIISILFMVFCRQIATFQSKGEIWILYSAIAPSVFFVCFISAFRGYFQGLSNMVPTGVSQIIEQLVKVGVGLALAVWFVKKSVLWAVFGAVLAVSISELIATIFLFVFYVRHKRLNKNLSSSPMFSLKDIDFTVIKKIFVTAAPITLMSIVFPLVLMFDSFFIVHALTDAGVENSTELYGVSSGAVHTLINLPTVIGMAIATALVPMVARYYKQGKTVQMKSKAKSAIWIIFAFAVAVAVAYLILAPLMLKILYAGAFRGKAEEFTIAVSLLRIESAAIILICMTQVITAILQGVDRSQWPLFGLLIGGAAKVAFEIFFVKSIGITAVSIANVLCFAAAFIVNIIIVMKFIYGRNNEKK